MTNPEPIEKIIKKIKRKWDQDKEDWHVISGVDKDGNHEMLINQAPHTYWLKMRQITANNTMAFGKELTNIDDEITKQIHGESARTIHNKQDLLQLFGMMVPSKKDNMVYTMAGTEKFSNEHIAQQKVKIEDKESDADKLYRLYLQKKWERQQQLRENMYM